MELGNQKKTKDRRMRDEKTGENWGKNSCAIYLWKHENQNKNVPLVKILKGLTTTKLLRVK